MSQFPDTPTQNVDRQQLGEESGVEDPYLAGFLAGLAAANANRDVNVQAPEAGFSLALEDPIALWPIYDDPTTTVLPSSGPFSQSHDLYTATATSLSQPQEFSTDHELQESSAAQPDLHLPSEIVGSGVDNYLLEFNSSTSTPYPPAPLDGTGWFQPSYGAPTSLTNQPPFLNEENLSLNPHLQPIVAISQYNWPALSAQQSSVPGLDDYNIIPHGTATNGDQPWNSTDTHVLPTTEVGVLIPTGSQLDAAPSTSDNREPNLMNREALVPDALSLSVTRRVQRPKSTVLSAPPGVTKQAAKVAIQTVWRAYGSKRSKFNKQSRKNTAFTREVGACETCRRKKLRCDQSSKEKFVPCGRCARLTPHLLPGPCCRVELIDIKLFRLGSAQNPTILQQWVLSKEASKNAPIAQESIASLEGPRRIYLAHDVTATTFAVTVDRFQPGVDDTTAYMWTDASGRKKEYVLPPYYITDMAEAGENMRQYVRIARPEFTRALLLNANPIVRKTFQEAERYYAASKSELVGDALMFWSATRMIERFWLICGPDMLGMVPMKENIGPCRRNQFVDSVPVTPVMDTQLDELAVTDVLIPLKAKLLRLLKLKVLAKKKEHWYEIYLASFIILHNAERVLDHVTDFARRFGVSPEPKSNQESSLSHAYYHACKTVLAYFHFACGGATPLSLEWGRSTQDTSGMTEHQIAYLRDVKAEMLHQDAQLNALKDMPMYETELYWCHQMLFPDWKADMPHSGKLLEFTEKDFLVT